jgi:monothiol glutaredoxin
MKGCPSHPQCGFSRTAVGMLAAAGCDAADADGTNKIAADVAVNAYAHFDILEDAEVRQGLKEYSSWPTCKFYFYLLALRAC